MFLNMRPGFVLVDCVLFNALWPCTVHASLLCWSIYFYLEVVAKNNFCSLPESSLIEIGFIACVLRQSKWKDVHYSPIADSEPSVHWRMSRLVLKFQSEWTDMDLGWMACIRHLSQVLTKHQRMSIELLNAVPMVTLLSLCLYWRCVLCLGAACHVLLWPQADFFPGFCEFCTISLLVLQLNGSGFFIGCLYETLCSTSFMGPSQMPFFCL